MTESIAPDGKPTGADNAESDVDAVGDVFEPAGVDDLSKAVAELAESDLNTAERRKVLGRVVSAVRERGVGRLFAPGKAVRWVTDAVADLAPHVPIRSYDTLRKHYPGLEGDALAERLVRNAARATAGIGAVGGGVASIEWAVPPTLLTTPVMLAVETVSVIGIELKLIGELHEVYGHPVAGTPGERAVSLLQSWAHQRGVNPLLPGGFGSLLGTAARKELRDMIVKRLGRNLTTLGPMLTGAAVASYLNRRSTKTLGEALMRDLRLRRRPALPPGPPPPQLPHVPEQRPEQP
jgi:hypothetical protein